MKKKKQRQARAQAGKRLLNKKAQLEYEITDTMEAGIELLGMEVKSLRQGRGSLRESFAKVSNGEAWVYNMHIPRYEFAAEEGYEPTRPRRLLLHKKEIIRLVQAMHNRISVVPMEVYVRGRVYKMKLGLGKGRKMYEKKEVLKRRDIEREMKRELRKEKYKT